MGAWGGCCPPPLACVCLSGNFAPFRLAFPISCGRAPIFFFLTGIRWDRTVPVRYLQGVVAFGAELLLYTVKSRKGDGWVARGFSTVPPPTLRLSIILSYLSLRWTD